MLLLTAALVLFVFVVVYIHGVDTQQDGVLAYCVDMHIVYSLSRRIFNIVLAVRILVIIY